GLPYCGIGENLKDSSKSLIITEDGVEIIILNFGWEVIQCEVSDTIKSGVNPLRKDHVLGTFKKVKKENENSKIVVFFHWNYELESFPHPRERELSKKLIDLGAIGIIGCHP